MQGPRQDESAALSAECRAPPRALGPETQRGAITTIGISTGWRWVCGPSARAKTSERSHGDRGAALRDAPLEASASIDPFGSSC